MDLAAYRGTSSEQQRTSDLARMMPTTGLRALDIGARDGHFSILMADRFDCVVALDLTMPCIDHPKVECVEGNAGAMPFANRSFDFVFCAEVLEHIPADRLDAVSREIERVARGKVLIGVPYRQDTRVGRTTCQNCGKPNPPWGHLNIFDEEKLQELFPSFDVEEISFVGTSSSKTNAFSTMLMDYAGNPYGTYSQEEPCVYCGSKILSPSSRNQFQLIATKIGFLARKTTEYFSKPHGNWIHMLLRRRVEP